MEQVQTLWSTGRVIAAVESGSFRTGRNRR